MIEFLIFLIIVRVVLDVTSNAFSLRLDYAYAVLFFIVGAIAFTDAPNDIWPYAAFAVAGYFLIVGISRQKPKNPSP